MGMGGDFSWAGIGVAIGAFVTGLFAWLAQRSKSGTDIEVAVLAEWQKLNGALSKRLADVEQEFADYRRRISDEFEQLRDKHAAEVNEMREGHRAEMRALRELNDGLQRQIAQNSKSTAQLLGRTPVPKDKPDGA
jgi:methyl-accepting chemotaxis protein